MRKLFPRNSTACEATLYKSAIRRANGFSNLIGPNAQIREVFAHLLLATAEFLVKMVIVEDNKCFAE